MTRGNQRDLARAKSQKKLQQLAKAEGSKDYAKRKERDSDIMREKQKKAAERAANGEEPPSDEQQQSKKPAKDKKK